MHRFNSTERFTTRVTDYVKFRPSYPAALIQYLCQDANLGPDCTVADIGSGTGILSELLLSTGARVFGVEPNQAMREAAELELKDVRRFVSINGTGEDSTLPIQSVDLITIAQAFHWMDPVATRAECLRILKPNGIVAIIWNNSKKESSPFAREYERLRKHYANPELKELSRYSSNSLEQIMMFFDNKSFARRSFDYVHELNGEGLIGRFFSASYAPAADSPERPLATRELGEAFDRHEVNGIVQMEYSTDIFLGRLT